MERAAVGLEQRSRAKVSTEQCACRAHRDMQNVARQGVDMESHSTWKGLPEQPASPLVTS